MANKIKNVYVCSNCGAQSIKWSGRCLECGGWNTLQLETVAEGDNKAAVSAVSAEIIDLAKISDKKLARLATGIEEFDRVLGGGIVPGSLILLSGEPGIGKSTIVAQVADKIGLSGKGKVFYVSGEESAAQVKSRLDRLNCGLENIKFASETDADKISAALRKEKPALAIIDSIQTVYCPEIATEAGGLSQIRAAAVKFLEVAKQDGIAVLLIGHITKDGQIAGPKSLEHIVDTVIYLEADTTNDYRVLRAIKNRFGSVNELGIFEMTGSGFKEIINPSLVFVETGLENIAGSVLSAVMEGTRPFIVNVQALATKTVFGYPQRRASGFDLNRLQVLAAVLTKKAKINLMAEDVVLNIVGGLKLNDPAMDLAVCLAIISSLLNKVIDNKTIVLGEVGLGGEVRSVPKLAERLKEAEKLGFTRAIIPDAKVSGGKIKLTKIKSVSELLSV
ncbi:MAG TPA: DNA repair protein RadA [Candidatus Nanoarchaeia archaeon]|nr:DNA repair protein RadA [Candidatus Nanoarchaeia archaeon]